MVAVLSSRLLGGTSRSWRIYPGRDVLFVDCPLACATVIGEQPTRKNISGNEALNWLFGKFATDNVSNLNRGQSISWELDRSNEYSCVLVNAAGSSEPGHVHLTQPHPCDGRRRQDGPPSAGVYQCGHFRKSTAGGRVEAW